MSNETTEPDKPLPVGGPDYVSAWLSEIESASAEEKDWRKDAEIASELHRGAGDSTNKTYNIFHSNIETICPAIYNSTPNPDVRRRYQDKDPVGKIVADIIERALSYSVDTYDFDDEMKSCVQDMVIVDRGIARVRYLPYFGSTGELVSEEVACEYVPWRSFRRGPARLWKDVPWVAFEHFLSKDQVRSLIGEQRWTEIGEQLPFRHSASSKDDKDSQNTAAPRFGKRMRVWEIWDKDERKVIFICPEYSDSAVIVVADPLGLQGFFPIPRPMYAIISTDSLVPVTPLSTYVDLLDELNKITRRISRLVTQLRPRGGYAGLNAADVIAIAEADDGILMPLTGAEMFATTGGGVEKAITWFPLEPTILALRQLVEQREIIKNLIFEVSGLADAMRGSVDPNEKLGQTQIKTQWGSLRVQNKQAEVARFSRDLFRIKAEIMAAKFSFDTLMMMTGIPLPTMQDKEVIQQKLAAAQSQQPEAPGQPPTPAPQITDEEKQIMASPPREEVERLLRQDTVRGYRIDIESDSHIRGDLMRSQQQMAMFLQGIAQYVQAVGPLVQQGAMPPDIAIDILGAFCRHFKLGKQAEDTLDQWVDRVKSMSSQPQQQKPDPAEAKAAMDQQLMQQKLQLGQANAETKMRGLQMEDQAKQAQFTRDMQLMDAKGQHDQAKLEREREEFFLEHQRRMAEQQQANPTQVGWPVIGIPQ